MLKKCFSHSTLRLILTVLAALCALSCSKGQEPEAREKSPANPKVKEYRTLASRFDAARAFSHLEAQTTLGPRVPGTSGHSECLSYIMRHLSSVAKSVQTQEFPIECYQEPAVGTNVIASFGKGNLDSILLCAHWDTRPVADNDPIPENRFKPILGANDGASGVAVLLELAMLFGEKPPPRQVYLVFFDAEDSGKYSGCEFCIGSQFFASKLGDVFTQPPASGILIDMIGDKDLSIPIERNSFSEAPEVVNRVWAIAGVLGHKQFRNELGHSVFDDHYWLNRAGIPTIDIIDFDFPAWHTLGDTADSCSKDSLKAVGDVLVVLAYGE